MEMFESGIHQVFVKLLDGKHRILNFDTPSISVPTLKSRIQAITSIPAHLQLLVSSNYRVLHEHQTLALAESREITGIPQTLDSNSDGHLPQRQNFDRFYDLDFPASSVVDGGSGELRFQSIREASKFPVVVHLLLRLRGGKGGFGSLLRGAATKAGQKKTNNFDACRDMSGRRLRHVNAEKKLEEWRAGENERKLERMAEEFLKKKAKDLAKSGKSKGGDVAEKYVAKYRDDSAKCMEVVEKSVRESIGLSFKRKGDTDDAEACPKRLKIWMGKRKLADSDSEDLDEDENELEENAKSLVTDDGNNSDSSKYAEGTSDSVTCDSHDVVSLDRASSESQEDATDDSPKSDNNEDIVVGDDKTLSMNDHTHEVSEEIIHQKVAEDEMISHDLQPAISISGEVVASAAGVDGDSISAPVEDGPVSCKPKVHDLGMPLNFDLYNSAVELEVLGMETLKAELQARGLKCGGTLQERAARLFMLKTIPLEMLPKKMFAAKK